MTATSSSNGSNSTGASGTDPAAVAEDLTSRGPVRGLPRAARVLASVRAGRPTPLARHPAGRAADDAVSSVPCAP